MKATVNFVQIFYNSAGSFLVNLFLQRSSYKHSKMCDNGKLSNVTPRDAYILNLRTCESVTFMAGSNRGCINIRVTNRLTSLRAS